MVSWEIAGTQSSPVVAFHGHQVKPTDWEKIRSRVGQFAEEALQNPSLAPKSIKKLALRMPERPTRFVTWYLKNMMEFFDTKTWKFVYSMGKFMCFCCLSSFTNKNQQKAWVL